MTPLSAPAVTSPAGPYSSRMTAATAPALEPATLGPGDFLCSDAAEIAARYGAKLAPGVAVKRVPMGATGLIEYAWDGRALCPTKPVGKVKLKFGKNGKPGVPVECPGYRWPSMTACAAALGVSKVAVFRAIEKGRLEALVRRARGAQS